MLILSTDSGLARTGYALFDKEENHFKLIYSGSILTDKKHPLALRLKLIYDSFEKLLKKYNPNSIIIEKIFFNTNQKTIVSIAQTQGVLLLLAAQNKIEVNFLTPLEIKQTVTGYGRADKLQVRKMVKLLLNKESLPKIDDEVDAIACGLAYCSIKQYDR